MSERVSWETCPGCGGRVAVGWRQRVDQSARGLDQEPVEADCFNGCALTKDEMQVFIVPAPASLA